MATILDTIQFLNSPSNTTVRKQDMFHSSGARGVTTQLRPMDRDELFFLIGQIEWGSFLYLMTETALVSGMLVFVGYVTTS
jgi:hypothetical protein